MCLLLMLFYQLIFLFFFLILYYLYLFFFFFSSRRRHTRCLSDWSSDVCSSDLTVGKAEEVRLPEGAQIIDAGGRFLIPGLWDMHIHSGSYEEGKKVFPLLKIGRASCRERV